MLPQPNLTVVRETTAFVLGPVSLRETEVLQVGVDISRKKNNKA